MLVALDRPAINRLLVVMVSEAAGPSRTTPLSARTGLIAPWRFCTSNRRNRYWSRPTSIMIISWCDA